jgi:hypothetical protein
LFLLRSSNPQQQHALYTQWAVENQFKDTMQQIQEKDRTVRRDFVGDFLQFVFFNFDGST